MNALELINNEKPVLDSREVASMVGKDHPHLLRDIQGYIKVLEKNPDLDCGLVANVEDYFIKKDYQAEEGGRKYTRYDVTKKGCDMIAHKLTGEKGVLFTAAYINKFYDMEEELKYNRFIKLLDKKIDEKLNKIETKCSTYYKPSCATKYSICKYIKQRLGIDKANDEYEMVKQRVLIILGGRVWEDVPMDVLSGSMKIIDESIEVIKKDRPYKQVTMFEPEYMRC